jgi:hypothetical protein
MGAAPFGWEPVPRREPSPRPDDPVLAGGPAGCGVELMAAGRLIRSGNGSSVSGLIGPPARLIATIPA